MCTAIISLIPLVVSSELAEMLNTVDTIIKVWLLLFLFRFHISTNYITPQLPTYISNNPQFFNSSWRWSCARSGSHPFTVACAIRPLSTKFSCLNNYPFDSHDLKALSLKNFHRFLSWLVMRIWCYIRILPFNKLIMIFILNTCLNGRVYWNWEVSLNTDQSLILPPTQHHSCFKH